MSDEIARMDATAQAELVRQKKISAYELVNSAIERIERLNPHVNAVILKLFENAHAATVGIVPDGPFRGVPFLLKDLDVFSAGEPFHGGMRLLKEAGYVPDTTSYLVDKFRMAGFVILGKTNTPELGLNVTTEPLAYGPSRNPWNLEHSTGGSSGGSGAAVACGMVPAAHASDGGGSIRIPASACGLVGLKPSRGRISMGPHFGEYWHGLVTSHVLTRSVRDSAAILDLAAGPMPGDPYSAPPPVRPFAHEVGSDPGELRIGLMAQAPAGVTPIDPEVRNAVVAAGKLLESLGHRVDEAYPSAMDEQERFSANFSTVVASWTAWTLRYWGDVIGRAISAQDVEFNTWMLAELGRATSVTQYVGAISELQAWTRRMAQWWADGFDLLVTPTLPALPPRLGELIASPDNPGAMSKVLEYMTFTPGFNVTGQPALSLPLAWSPRGLPIGVQFVAAYGREDLLLRVAAQLEQAQPWTDRLPPTFPQ